MQLHLVIERGAMLTKFVRDCQSLTIGRSGGSQLVDLDFSGDDRVSRRHARIWLERGSWWVEDSDSRHGTLLDGEEIRATGPQSLLPGCVLQIGDSRIRVPGGGKGAMEEAVCEAVTKPLQPAPKAPEPVKKPVEPAVPPPPAEPAEPAPPEKPSAKSAASKRLDGSLTIGTRLAAAEAGIVAPGEGSTELERHLELLCELPLKLAAETQLDRVFQVAVEYAIQIVPGAGRAAVLLVDRRGKHLMLKAHRPSTFRPSEELARRALATGEGFLWHHEGGKLPLEHTGAFGAGIYVPLVCAGEAIGVLCVDEPLRTEPFTAMELRLLRALTQATGMVISQHEAREALARQSEFTQRLFSARFSEKVRENLVRETAAGSLPIGTRRSEVTVLISDIRGFTQLSLQLGPLKMGDLLNDYFPPLTEAIFRYGGSIDRFAGDAIFAVFGSPEPDDDQHENAVRAALAMQEVMADVTKHRERRKRPVCGIGIGIDCGDVLHGFVGNADYLQFTIIGDAANFASRYCSAAQAGEVVISLNVHARVWKLVQSEPRMIETKHEGPQEAHLVRGVKGV